MKRFLGILLFFTMAAALSSCTNSTPQASNPSAPSSFSSPVSSSSQPASNLPSSTAEISSSPEEAPGENRQICVQFGENTVVYQLNGSAAATALYEQLPLTIEVEDYSTNEKIFYPPQPLDTTDAPLAQGGAGTLAYYAPWADVVMFYGSYSQNSSLFALGQVFSGGELVEQMAGTVTISAVN